MVPPSPTASVRLTLLALALVGAACSGEGEKESAAKPTVGRHGLTAEQAAAVLAKVGPVQITVGDFADQLAEQSPYLRARYNSPERRKEYLDSLVRFELLALEAKKRGFFENEDVVRANKQAMIQQMMRADFEEKFKLADVTDADIKAHYEKNVAEYRKPEQARLSHILVKNRSVAQRAMGQLLEKPGDDALWKRLAEQLNEDPATKDTFGDLGFLSRPADRTKDEPAPGVPDAVIEAGYALKNPGDLHGTLVETPVGFHIVRLVARRPALTRTLEDARRTIQDRLRRDRRDAAIEALVAELRAKSSVKEDLALLSQVKVDTSAPPDPTGRGALRAPISAAAPAKK